MKKKNNKIRNSVTNLKKIVIFQSFSPAPQECSERIHPPHAHINNDVKNLTLYPKEIKSSFLCITNFDLLLVT